MDELNMPAQTWRRVTVRFGHSPYFVGSYDAASIHMGEWGGSGPPSHVVSVVSHQGWWIWTGPATVSHPVPLGTKGMCLWESWMFSGVRSVTKGKTKEEKRSAWSRLPRLWLVYTVILPTKLTAPLACSLRQEGSLGTSASWQYPERLIAAAETPWKRVLREIRPLPTADLSSKSDFPTALPWNSESNLS